MKSVIPAFRMRDHFQKRPNRQETAMSRSFALKSPSRFVTEEVANQWTHGIGFALSLPAGWWLIRATLSRHNDWLTAGCAIYAVTLSLLYAASTLSHSVHGGVWRHRFRTLDQVCIFLLTAGSYTPFGMAFLRDGWWGVLLIGIWVLAGVGIVLKLFFTRLHNVSTAFYLLVGWVPILAAPHYYRCLGTEGVAWIVACAAAYSCGTWFLVNDQRRLFHSVWHVLVMLGSTCHYVLVLRYIVPCA
jgi:hemolysin III